MSAKISPWLSENNNDNIENNLTPTLSGWLNDVNYNTAVTENLQTTSTYSIASAGSRAYGQYFESDYDAHGDDGSGYDNYQYSVTSYSDEGYAIYIEDSGHDAYGRDYYSDYSNYGDYYGNYYNYSNAYGNYSQVIATFYWTKDNDGVNKMTGLETGLISTWAMAVQVNTLINLINKCLGTSINTINSGDLLTDELYNEIALAIEAPTITAGTKITVTHFYDLQQIFNSREYTYTP